MFSDSTYIAIMNAALAGQLILELLEWDPIRRLLHHMFNPTPQISAGTSNDGNNTDGTRNSRKATEAPLMNTNMSMVHFERQMSAGPSNIPVALSELSTSMDRYERTMSAGLSKIETGLSNLEAGFSNIEVGVSNVEAGVSKLSAAMERYERTMSAGLSDIELRLAQQSKDLKESAPSFKQADRPDEAQYKGVCHERMLLEGPDGA